MNESARTQEVAAYTRMSGEVYDLIYAEKDYAGQAQKVAEIIKARCESGGNLLLEAACGTGVYMQYLTPAFAVEGFDLSSGQVEAAQKRLPGARIVVADMIDFDMGQTYDAVVCLFSSIGYLKSKDNLDKAIANMAHHTKPGGVLIVEPWLGVEDFKPGHISLETSSDEKMTVARMGISSQEGNISVVDMHHMVGTENGIEHFVERNELAMYSDEEFADAFAKAGVGLEIDPEGLTDRRLCIGKKPL